MPNQNVGAIIQQAVYNAIVPKEGPITLGAILNFTGGILSAQVDLTQNQMAAQIGGVQTLFVDNSLSAIGLICSVSGTGQKIITPSAAQQYAPVLCQNPPIFTFTGVGGASPNVLIPVFFVNVPVDSSVWKIA